MKSLFSYISPFLFLLLFSGSAFCGNGPLIYSTSSSRSSTSFDPSATNACLRSAMAYANSLTNSLTETHNADFAFASGLRCLAGDVVVPPNSDLVALVSDHITVTNLTSGLNLFISLDIIAPTPGLVSASVSNLMPRSFDVDLSFDSGVTDPVDFYLILSCTKTGGSPDCPIISKPFLFRSISR